MIDSLSKYVCTRPFNYVEIQKDGVYSCCTTWLPNKVCEINQIDGSWISDNLKEVHESILDGSYKFCSKSKCPHLSKLINTGTPVEGNLFIEKSLFDYEKYKTGPTDINFALERSCNLSCPSCRDNVIMAKGEEFKFIDDTINKSIDVYGKNLEYIYLSGTADPFASKTFRNFLINFDKTKFPKLQNIHLHTNGLLLNKKMWESLKNSHEYINSIEISIDASTKETYEKVRRGGDWFMLLENLKYISTLDIPYKKVSFVVQDNNYFEMLEFYNLMSDIFNNDVFFFYNKISNWGTFTDEEYSIKQIWNENHPEFDKFLIELKKITELERCQHNMHDLI